MLVSIGALAAGCGSSGESSGTPVESAPAAPTTLTASPTATPTTAAATGAGGIAGAVEAAVGGIDDASIEVCTINRQTLETGTQAYEALNGSLPTSQDDLVVAALILEPVPGFEITADGLIQATVGGPCVGP